MLEGMQPINSALPRWRHDDEAHRHSNTLMTTPAHNHRTSQIDGDDDTQSAAPQWHVATDECLRTYSDDDEMPAASVRWWWQRSPQLQLET